jgi:hypothetical protein
VGFEPPYKSPRNPPLPDEGGAESGALAAIDPNLAAVVAAWPTLPEAIRAGIAAMVRAAQEQRK